MKGFFPKEDNVAHFLFDICCMYWDNFRMLKYKVRRVI